MSLPQLILENQFGEESINQVLGGTASLTSPIAANSVLANDTGSSALPLAVTYANISQHLPAKSGITAISSLATPITAVTIALSTSNTYSDSAVNTAVNAALVTVVADMQTQLTAINAMLAALKAIT